MTPTSKISRGFPLTPGYQINVKLMRKLRFITDKKLEKDVVLCVFLSFLLITTDKVRGMGKISKGGIGVM
jgi:hypothetical protein